MSTCTFSWYKRYWRNWTYIVTISERFHKSIYSRNYITVQNSGNKQLLSPSRTFNGRVSVMEVPLQSQLVGLLAKRLPDSQNLHN